MKIASLFVALSVVLGCSGSSDSTEGSNGPAGARSGQRGAFSFELSPRGEPVQGTNTFDLRIRRASGEPVARADLAVECLMPAMGHGTGARPLVEEPSPGAYVVRDVVFGMPGEWRLKVDATADAASDEAEFTFDVD